MEKIKFISKSNLNYNTECIENFIIDSYYDAELLNFGAIKDSDGFTTGRDFIFKVKLTNGRVFNGVIKYCHNINKYTMYLLHDRSRVITLDSLFVSSIIPTKNNIYKKEDQIKKLEYCLCKLSSKNINDEFSGYIKFIKNMITKLKNGDIEKRISDIESKFNSSISTPIYDFCDLYYHTSEGHKHYFTFSMN